MAIKDDYLARAAAAFAEAETAGLLQNVKDRCLRSAAAWSEMAAAAQKIETLRVDREAQSAAVKASVATQERDVLALEACNG